MRPLITVFLLTLFSVPAAWSAGGGSMQTPSAPARSESPEDQARSAHNAGVRLIAKADDLQADAARHADARKRDKLLRKSRDSYASALRQFTKATELAPRMHEAWNYRGYANRKLGDYQAALTAYDRALALQPGYAQAIEYRGHAYLGLGRLDDAKDAYLTLFSSNRALASTLLAAMQEWVGAHRSDGQPAEAFAAWVSERSSIASQTAGLTREGAAASWR